MGQLSRNDIRIDITIPSDTRYLGMIGCLGENLAYSLTPAHEPPCDFPYNLNLVLTEAVTNAIDHGNRRDPQKSVRILLTVSELNLVIRIYDQGRGFDLDKQGLKRPYKEDEGGRGIHLILKLMDQVEYRHESCGSVLTLTKKLTGP
jgi:serine/threonine-protein kinase RsbW